MKRARSSDGVAGFLAIAALWGTLACVPDSGPNVHGSRYGALPDREDGATGGDGGPSGSHDGAASTDGGSDPDEPCNEGTTALIAGNDSSLTAAVRVGNGPWTATTVDGSGAKSVPSIAAFGGGFLALTHAPAAAGGDRLASLTYEAAWSGPQPIGVAGVKGSPSLAVAGDAAHVVYSSGADANRLFFHGIHSGGSWNGADGPVGDPQSWGTVAAAVGAAGGDVVFAENGENQGLYTREFTAQWSAPAALVGAGTIGNKQPAPPQLVALDGAEIDSVLVYVEKDERIAFATRAADSGTWTDRDRIPAYLKTQERFSVARIGDFTLLLALRGTDGNAYYVSGTVVGSTVSWSSVAPLGGVTTSVDSTPAIAKGVCGDDAVVAYASGGTVRTVRLRGTVWTEAAVVDGTAGSRVAIATR